MIPSVTVTSTRCRSLQTGYSPRGRPTTQPAFRTTEDLHGDGPHNQRRAARDGSLRRSEAPDRPAVPTERLHPVSVPVATLKPRPPYSSPPPPSADANSAM